jgi:hypothetical protein
MKILFEDDSYIEIAHSDTPNKVLISIGAKSAKNPLETIINCVEISLNEFKDLCSNLK